MMNFVWLMVFVAIGFPIAAGIESFLRASRRYRPLRQSLNLDEFMPVPDDSAIARRTREPAHAAVMAKLANLE